LENVSSEKSKCLGRPHVGPFRHFARPTWTFSDDVGGNIDDNDDISKASFRKLQTGGSQVKDRSSVEMSSDESSGQTGDDFAEIVGSNSGQVSRRRFLSARTRQKNSKTTAGQKFRMKVSQLNHRPFSHTIIDFRHETLFRRNKHIFLIFFVDYLAKLKFLFYFFQQERRLCFVTLICKSIS
jgi:hypothetical protein